MGEFGRRWTSSAHPSDIDSDYRRDLATSGHQEARGRDGGGTFRRSSPSVGRSSSSAREEERRKVLEIEREMARRGGSQQVGRSTSRASRGTGRQQVIVRTRPMSQDDRDSQYSGHSSSSAKHRFEHPQNGARLARIKRSTSNATSAGVNGGGPRVVQQHRKKLPASLTSSLNSSESEPVANGNNANGNRSVFLHSACVADIPPNSVEKHQKPQPRAQSAESRENNNNTLARQQQQQSNLQKSKKISRSISLLAPWKRQPRSQSSGAQFSEIHYDNNNIYGQGGGMSSSGKPPRPPPPSQRGRIIIPAGDKKSASSTNLLKTDSEQMIVGNERSRTLQRSSNNGNSSKVSRSVSMPKDTRLAGWFRKKKR